MLPEALESWRACTNGVRGSGISGSEPLTQIEFGSNGLPEAGGGLGGRLLKFV